jgi:hypothetical protein
VDAGLLRPATLTLAVPRNDAVFYLLFFIHHFICSSLRGGTKQFAMTAQGLSWLCNSEKYFSVIARSATTKQSRKTVNAGLLQPFGLRNDGTGAFMALQFGKIMNGKFQRHCEECNDEATEAKRSSTKLI